MIDVSVTIDRTSLSLSALELTDANGYILDRDNFGAAGVTWDIAYVSAPDYHGDDAMRARKTNSSWQLQYEVTGADAAAAKAAKDALCDAVSQFSYTMTLTQDGISEVWTCDPASWQIGGDVMDNSLETDVWQIVLTIPVYPIAAAV